MYASARTGFIIALPAVMPAITKPPISLRQLALIS